MVLTSSLDVSVAVHVVRQEALSAVVTSHQAPLATFGNHLLRAGGRDRITDPASPTGPDVDKLRGP